MKTLVNINEWKRREHFGFFSNFEEPFFGVTVNMDCTEAHKKARAKEQSFFLYYLYRALAAANTVENFRYRIIDKAVYLFDQVNASPTINRPNNTFGFAYMDYHPEEAIFYNEALKEIQRVQHGSDLMAAVSGENVIHFSAIPWIDFTSISHARSFSFADSAPKISFGKISSREGKQTMPLSVHIHHGLGDGYHVGLFIEAFRELMNS